MYRLFQSLELEPRIMAEAFREHAGFSVSPASIVPEWRWWRWVVHLPGWHIAFIPIDEAGAEHLSVERRVLETLRGRLSFAIPRVVGVGPGGNFDIRRKTPGYVLPESQVESFLKQRSLSKRFAREFGNALWEIHSAVPRNTLAGLGLKSIRFPPSAADCRRLITQLSIEPDLSHELMGILDAYEILQVSPTELCLCHGDLRIENVSLNLNNGGVVGLFDFDGVAIGDRHSDLAFAFRFDNECRNAVLDSYQSSSELEILPERSKLYYLVGVIADLFHSIKHNDGNNVQRLIKIVKWGRNEGQYNLSH